MIFSIIIKNIKIHQNLNYVPISNSSFFSALIGENGIGKSSILEAFNSYFNNAEWNINFTVSEKGFNQREPQITPIFLIPKEAILQYKKVCEIINPISNALWNAKSKDFHLTNQKHGKQFCAHRDELQKSAPRFNSETHYLFPLGLIQENKSTINPTFSIFESLIDPLIDNLEAADKNFIQTLKDFVHNYYRYIYIPADIDLTAYTKIEGKTIQALMGKKIEEIVKPFISNRQIQEINNKLNDFIKSISERMNNKYTYKKPSKRQDMFNLTHFTSKVIEAYFETKVLNYHNSQGQDIPVYNLSSGEKRQAIIDVASAFLKSTNSHKNKQVIFGIDEPEISLHTSACFGQFEKLKQMSDYGVQTLITTHWYGFMPAISNGIAIYLSNNLIGDDGKEIFSADAISLDTFRDDVKRLKESSKGCLPSDISLKGINDLVQSIISSITSSNFKWIICEGTSDKIYLDHFIRDTNVFILPMGKSKNVKRVFNYLYLALEEDREEIKGKVFLLLDTDKKFERFDSKNSIKDIRIRRLQNFTDSKKTSLETTGNNHFFPPTEIEDSLNADVFLKTLKSFADKPEFNEYLNELVESLTTVDSNAPSGLAYDLKQSQQEQLENFFNLPTVKVNFAKKYIELDTKHLTPKWVDHITDFLKLSSEKT